ncbi:MAG: hypothetical protein GY913_09265 [Proteobacteria bacterium]|nr:hypothetical protein [Pseudomonadota bacterium]MCP4917101.1 hypothetical protein [Pseudomonadota bacterium]
MHISILLALGCIKSEVPTDSNLDSGPVLIDEDGDGWALEDDCDDDDAAVNPDAAEICDDIDNDCDGTVDQDATDAPTWWTDADEDGRGDPASPTLSCEQPDGTVDNEGDCDDSDAAFHPGADESDCTDPSDYNCDGSVGYADEDADGWPACEDCDDTSADVNPDGEEVCDDSDNDRDSMVDEDDATDAETWYADADSDGYGDASTDLTQCEQPSGYVDDDQDCDDTDGDLNPDTVWYADSDTDGYGRRRLRGRGLAVHRRAGQQGLRRELDRRVGGDVLGGDLGDHEQPGRHRDGRRALLGCGHDRLLLERRSDLEVQHQLMHQFGRLREVEALPLERLRSWDARRRRHDLGRRLQRLQRIPPRNPS